MTESHRPRLTVDGLTALLRRELDAQPQPGASDPFDLDDIETLLRAAEERSRPRTQLPPQLNRFPLSWSPRLQQLVLKLYKRLFHDQRAVNTVLIQALRETLAVNRYLLGVLAERELPARADGLPRLLTPPDGGTESCAS
jgi:hypothetical protein